MSDLDTFFFLFFYKFFIFLILSKNDIYTKGYSMQEKYRANHKITTTKKKKKKQGKYIKENQTTD